MKVRWMNGSVRLRIAPAEMEALLRGEPVVAALSLGAGGAWTATLAPRQPATALGMTGGHLTISLTDEDMGLFQAGETDGLYFTHLLADGTPFRYYVEKDWACAHPRSTEPYHETYPRPAGR